MKTKQTTNGMYALLVVVAAFLATGIYFACSADDDWEGDPEYLMTHAPMMTRAGVEGGVPEDDDDNFVVRNLVYKNNFNSCSQDFKVKASSLFGGSVTFTISSVNGRLVANTLFSHSKNIPSVQNEGNAKFILLSAEFTEQRPVVNAQGLDSNNPTVTISSTLNISYRIIYNISDDPIARDYNDNIEVTKDITEFTEWQYTNSNNNSQLDETTSISDSLFTDSLVSE